MACSAPTEVREVIKYDTAKVEEAVLALLGVFEFESGRVWKRFDFDVMDSLHAKGYITDPKSHRESVYLTEEGMALAKRLAKEHFDLEDSKVSGRS